MRREVGRHLEWRLALCRHRAVGAWSLIRQFHTAAWQEHQPGSHSEATTQWPLSPSSATLEVAFYSDGESRSGMQKAEGSVESCELFERLWAFTERVLHFQIKGEESSKRTPLQAFSCT